MFEVWRSSRGVIGVVISWVVGWVLVVIFSRRIGVIRVVARIILVILICWLGWIDVK